MQKKNHFQLHFSWKILRAKGCVALQIQLLVSNQILNENCDKKRDIISERTLSDQLPSLESFTKLLTKLVKCLQNQDLDNLFVKICRFVISQFYSWVSFVWGCKISWVVKYTPGHEYFQLIGYLIDIQDCYILIVYRPGAAENAAPMSMAAALALSLLLIDS